MDAAPVIAYIRRVRLLLLLSALLSALSGVVGGRVQAQPAVAAASAATAVAVLRVAARPAARAFVGVSVPPLSAVLDAAAPRVPVVPPRRLFAERRRE